MPPKEKSDLDSFITVFNQLDANILEKQQSNISPQSHQTATDVLASQTLKFESINNEKETFTSYRQLENFITVKRLSNGSTESKSSRLRLPKNFLGNKYYQLLQSLTAPALPLSKSYNELISLLGSHLCSKLNVLIERHKFFSGIKLSDELLAQFIATLRQQTNFDSIKN